MTYQDSGNFVSDPAGGAENFPLDVAGAFLKPIYTMIAMDDPGNGAAGRIGRAAAVGPQFNINTPATPGGIPLYYSARDEHSIFQPWSDPFETDGPRYFFSFVNVAAATEVTVPHSMGALPDMITAEPYTDTQQGTDWAVTEISSTQFKIRNWDAVNGINIVFQAWRVHSIQTPAETANLGFAVLNGAGVVTVPHGLGRTPDLISVFPYETLGVQPGGLPIMDSAADDTNIYLRNVAGSQLNAQIYVQATHSIQL